MKTLRQHIQEAFRINQDNKPDQYTCQPKTNTELREILRDRLAKDKNADLNDIDVSKITDMTQLFVFLDPHNINISEWDVSKVTNMKFMFYECTHLNCDLSKWDVSKVENMNNMFDSCNAFEGEGLENWDVSNVRDMHNMFDGCDSLKNKPSWYEK